jgi:hypothetical protein
LDATPILSITNERGLNSVHLLSKEDEKNVYSKKLKSNIGKEEKRKQKEKMDW